MKKYVYLFLVILCVACNKQQNTQLVFEKVPSINMQIGHLITDADTISFVKYDTINEKKPLFVFLQGSLPRPLIIQVDDNFLWWADMSNIDASVLTSCHVIEIVPPFTPIIASMEYLDNNYAYCPTTEKGVYDENYRLNDKLEVYVDRANKIINALAKEQWIESDSIFIYGYSQGFHVAANVANFNPLVRAVGLISSNPFGRIHTTIDKYRVEVIKGKMTEEDFQKQIQEIYDYWEYLATTPDSIFIKEKNIGDTPSNKFDFSQSSVAILCNLKQPLFIAYGTRDIGRTACDLLPFYFIMAGKKNYKMRPALGRGHSFEVVRDDGSHDFDDRYPEKISAEFLEYVRSN